MNYFWKSVFLLWISGWFWPKPFLLDMRCQAYWTNPLISGPLWAKTAISSMAADTKTKDDWPLSLPPPPKFNVPPPPILAFVLKKRIFTLNFRLILAKTILAWHEVSSILNKPINIWSTVGQDRHQLDGCRHKDKGRLAFISAATAQIQRTPSPYSGLRWGLSTSAGTRLNGTSKWRYIQLLF